MQNNPDDVRDRLKRIAKQLAKLSFPTSPITVDDAHWLATCLGAYLTAHHAYEKAQDESKTPASSAHKAPSLDAALGLKNPRGAPRSQIQKKELIARAWISNQGMTWQQLAEFVHLEYPRIFTVEPDEKEVRRAIGGRELEKWTPIAIEAVSDEISRRLRAERT